MALKNGVSFAEFSNALKHAYVDVAKRQIKGAGNSVTPEGIFVITSIEASEVERLGQSDIASDVDLDAQSHNPLPRVLNAWHTDQQYTGPYGVLRDLEFERSKSLAAEGPAFSDLVKAYCPGVPPKVVLEELVRTGCVTNLGNGVFRAISRSYVPDPLSRESIRLVAQVVHNLCETLEVNQRPESRGGHGLVQRTVYTRNGVSAENMDRFQAHVRARGQLFADEIDDWFVTHQEPQPSASSVKTGVGFYLYKSNDDDESEFASELPIEGDES